MGKKLLPIIIVVILIIIGTVTVSVVSATKTASETVFVGSNNAPEEDIPIIERHFKEKTPFSILALGYGGGNHDGTYLTDSIILSRIDPKSKTITLISIPRDVWISLPTNTTQETNWKINSAYQIGLDDVDYPNKPAKFKGKEGPGNLAKFAVEQVAGLPVDYFVAVNFDGFKNTIDTLGGVEINVEKTFDDYEYPIAGKETDLCGKTEVDLPELEKIATVSAREAFPCRYKHIHFDKGSTHMDGQSALEYVRSRHSLQDGTDFGRARRQQNLLLAVRDRIFSIDFLPKAIPFILSLSDDVRTDLSPSDLQILLSHAKELNSYTVRSIALTNENYLEDALSEDGQSILIPVAGEGNWKEIHTWIQNSLNRKLIASSPIIQIENGTYIAGLGGIATNRLKDKDFNVLPPTTAASQTHNTTSITVYSNDIDQQVLNDLKKEFGVSKVTKKNGGQDLYDILITLGENYNNLRGKKLIN